MWSWPLIGKQAEAIRDERGSTCFLDAARMLAALIKEYLILSLTLVVDRVGHHRAEAVFFAVVPLELTLETQTHSVHVHVLDALCVAS